MPIHILCADDVYYGNGSRSVQSDLCAVQFVVHDVYYVYNWLVAAYHPKACPQTPHVPWLLLACQINVTLTTSLPRLLALHRRPARTAPVEQRWCFSLFFFPFSTRYNKQNGKQYRYVPCQCEKGRSVKGLQVPVENVNQLLVSKVDGSREVGGV